MQQYLKEMKKDCSVTEDSEACIMYGYKNGLKA